MKVFRRKPDKETMKKELSIVITELNQPEMLTNVKKSEKLHVESLLDGAADMQRNCSDFVWSAKDITVHEVLGGYVLYFRTAENGQTLGDRVITDHAFSQLGGRYGIPMQYVKKCTLKNYTNLVEENFNHWLVDDSGSLFIREYNNIVRGILTPKYKVYDTPEILSSINKSPLKDWNVRQYLISPERFHLRLVSDSQLKVYGEDLYMGIVVDSSDVGRNSLSMKVIIFKQVCMNGLILPKSIGDLYRQPHIGVGADEFPNRIAAVLESVPEIMKMAEKMLNNVLNAPLPFKVEDEDSIAKYRKHNGVPKEFMQKVIEMYQNKLKAKIISIKQPRWGMINCMTELAQNYGIDTRLEFEKAAGELLVG